MAQSRIEAILENILGSENEILDPVSRNETLLIQISDLLDNMEPSTPITSADVNEIISTIN